MSLSSLPISETSEIDTEMASSPPLTKAQLALKPTLEDSIWAKPIEKTRFEGTFDFLAELPKPKKVAKPTRRVLFPISEEHSRKRLANFSNDDTSEREANKHSLNSIKAVLEEAIWPLKQEILAQNQEIKELKELVKKSLNKEIKTTRIENKREENSVNSNNSQAIKIGPNLVVRTAKQTAEKTAQKPAEKTAQKTAEKTAQKTVEKTTQKTAEKTAQKTFAEIVQQNMDNKQANRWELVSKKTKIPKELSQLAPKNGLIAAVDRRILFTRENGRENVDLQDLLLTLNRVLVKAQMPQHIRLLSLSFSPNGAISGLLRDKSTAEMLKPVQKELLSAAKEVDPSIKNLSAAENWHKIKVHKIDLFRYFRKGGLTLLKEEIETTMGLDLPLTPNWLKKDLSDRFHTGEIAYSTVLLTVRDIATAESCIANGLYFGGLNHKCEKFVENKPWDLCPNCCEYGHNGHKKCEKTAKCYICAKNHPTIEHKCIVNGCTAKTGKICIHYAKKCVNCQEAHFANSESCPKRRQLIKLAMQKKSEKKGVKNTLFSSETSKIQVIIPSKSTNIITDKDTQMQIEEL